LAVITDYDYSLILVCCASRIDDYLEILHVVTRLFAAVAALCLLVGGCAPALIQSKKFDSRLQVKDDQWAQLDGRDNDKSRYVRACPTDGAPDNFSLSQHVLVSNSEGGIEKDRHGESFMQAFRTIMDGYAQKALAAEQVGQDWPRLLFYFNGGLNAQEDVELQAARQIPCMLADGFYPVFFVWDTNYVRTYIEQISAVSDGQIDRSGWTMALAPFKVIGNLISGIGAAPTDYAVHGRRFFNALRREPHCYLELLPEEDCPQEQAVPLVVDNGGIVNAEHNVVVDKSLVDGNQAEIGRFIAYSATWPIRMITTPLAHGLGDSAWRNMVRRTRTTMRRSIEFNLNRHTDYDGDDVIDGPSQCPKDFLETMKYYPHGTGVFARFFENLLRYRSASNAIEAPAPNKWYCKHDQATGQDHDEAAGPLSGEALAQDRRIWQVLRAPETAGSRSARITLIGHSMGAIVINELLFRFDDLPYENVVLMASAASMRETKRVMDRYFEQYFKQNAPCAQDKKGYYNCNGRNTHLYSLMLHPLNDARERQLWNTVPSGSLLMWVDEMYESPKTPEDKTFGFWPTAKSARDMFGAAAKSRTLYRVFNRPDAAVDAAANPMEHSDFNDDDMCFWRPSFWGVKDTNLEVLYTDLPSHAQEPCRNKG
jgi:pimeloyl-ACP methyl ester carboxylesterase